MKYDYDVDNQAYVQIQGIKRKLDNTKKGPYPITQVFTNGTVRIQRSSVNELINILLLEPVFE